MRELKIRVNGTRVGVLLYVSLYLFEIKARVLRLKRAILIRQKGGHRARASRVVIVCSKCLLGVMKVAGAKGDYSRERGQGFAFFL